MLRHAPSETFASILEPVFFDGALILKHDLRKDGRGPLWSVLDLLGGTTRRVLPPGKTPLEWSNPGVAPDGRTAALLFDSFEEGIFLQAFDARGHAHPPLRTLFSYAHSEGPEWSAGPGPMLPPVAGPGETWLTCVAESTHDAAPWDMVLFDAARGERVWERTGYLAGYTDRTALTLSGRGRYEGVDIAGGETRWTLDSRDASTAVGAGVFAIADGRTEIRLRCVDADSGALLFERVLPGSEANFSPGRLAVARNGVLFRNFHDGTLTLFDRSGTTILEKQTDVDPVAFDGDRILSADSTKLRCGPVAEPGAWAWEITPGPDAMHRALGITAKDGWLCVAPSGLGRVWIYGPA